MEVETKWHRYDINRPRWGHGHRYSRYRKSLAMIMLTCIKKHLSNIWSWIHEKVNTEAELKNCVAYRKSMNISGGFDTVIL